MSVTAAADDGLPLDDFWRHRHEVFEQKNRIGRGVVMKKSTAKRLESVPDGFASTVSRFGSRRG